MPSLAAATCRALAMGDVPPATPPGKTVPCNAFRPHEALRQAREFPPLAFSPPPPSLRRALASAQDPPVAAASRAPSPPPMHAVAPALLSWAPRASPVARS